MQMSLPRLTRLAMILIAATPLSCISEQQHAPAPLSHSATETIQLASTGKRQNKSSKIADKLIFMDKFEYSVSREKNHDGYTTFKQMGGWSHIKATNITGSHAGYLYTVDKIPGYSDSFPGRNSKKVLAIEARAGSMDTQTDFYLQYGREDGPNNTVPGNVWFQFWIYPNNKLNQRSAFGHRFKFIYPCNAPYPCRMGKMNWLHTLGNTTAEPFWLNQPNTELFMTAVDPFNTSIRYLDAPEWNQFKIGQTDVSEHIVPNRWTLVKLHYDTSTSSGSYEAWLKPMGGKWVKVAEWIDGLTRNFEWKIEKGSIGGHKTFRMPTTIGSYDSWIYLDDFAMATSEESLPKY